MVGLQLRPGILDTMQREPDPEDYARMVAALDEIGSRREGWTHQDSIDLADAVWWRTWLHTIHELLGAPYGPWLCEVDDSEADRVARVVLPTLGIEPTPRAEDRSQRC